MATTTKKRSSSSSSSKKKGGTSRSSSSSSSSSAPANASSSSSSPRAGFKDWPRKGYSGAQPWDWDALGIDKPHQLEDKDVPVNVTHPYPTVTEGEAGEAVRDLGQRLSDLGYETSIVDGTNPFNVFDASVVRAVEKFRDDYGVQEAPTEAFGGDTTEGRQRANRFVSAYTWEAIVRASDRAREAREQ